MIWIVADTHFGHRNIIKYENRPEDYDSIIVKNWNAVVKSSDTVIHLGDIHLGGIESWFKYIKRLNGHIILVRGNHDNKSNTWYINNGIKFICDAFTLKTHGLHILFTHEPIPNPLDFDFNIHGHLHINKHRAFEESDKHLLFSIERENYKPVKLDDFIRRLPQPVESSNG